MADLTAGLASRGHELIVVALRWRGDVLNDRPGVCVRAADVDLPYRPLPSAPGAWPLALAALARTAGRVTESGGSRPWLANWWPTSLAAPRQAACVGILHGSDVDWAERWPSALVDGLSHRLGGAIAVAEHLAERFARRSGVPQLGVCPLGAAADPGGPSAVPREFAHWARGGRAKVLVVARDRADPRRRAGPEGRRDLRQVEPPVRHVRGGIDDTGHQVITQP
ncbi:MAG: glycosyltransferase, partial [Myxococcota bacterium]|nr:glycosyltransferase [Myxococcota bacterium]